MKHTILTTIPFAGFYGDAHDYYYNRQIESIYDYYACETPDNMPDWLSDLAWDSADFENYCAEYSKEYAESFLEWLGLDGEFESLQSPNYYNFETDRIFVKISRDALARAWKNTDKDILDRICNERFTSRDGFISHYSADWESWGRLSKWDHNQTGAIMSALAETEQGSAFDFYDEHCLMESFCCNGGVDNAMWHGDKGERFWRVFNYMMARANRPVRTLEQWHAARRAENRPFADTPLGTWGVVS